MYLLSHKCGVYLKLVWQAEEGNPPLHYYRSSPFCSRSLRVHRSPHIFPHGRHMVTNSLPRLSAAKYLKKAYKSNQSDRKICVNIFDDFPIGLTLFSTFFIPRHIITIFS